MSLSCWEEWLIFIWLDRYPYNEMWLAWIILLNSNNCQLGDGVVRQLVSILVAERDFSHSCGILPHSSLLLPPVTCWGREQPLVVEFIYHRFWGWVFSHTSGGPQPGQCVHSADSHFRGVKGLQSMDLLNSHTWHCSLQPASLLRMTFCLC